MVTRLERDIIRRVNEARERAGVSRGDLARVLSLTENSYGHYERLRTPFSVEQLFLLAPVLGVSVAWLLGLDTGLLPEEDQLVALFRSCEAAKRGEILAVVQALVGRL